jgi:hypothetical protein
MFGISVVPSILLVLGMAICPESPRWLYQVVSLCELNITEQRCICVYNALPSKDITRSLVKLQ